jgi:hypothetical protein
MAVAAEGPKFNIVQVQIDNGEARVLDPPLYPGWNGGIQARIDSEREGVQGVLSGNETGVNTQRVADFIGSLGLPMRPNVVADNLQDSSTRQVLDKYDATFDEGELSRYVKELGLIIVDRTAHPNSAAAESSLVYTAAQASGILTLNVVIDERGVREREYVSERGFRTVDHTGEITGGAMAEGAFAVLVEGAYRHNQEKDRPYEHGPAWMFTVGRVHPKYLHHNQTGRAHIMGALGLEVLCAQHPEVAPALIKARQSREGITELEALLNGIAPNLGSRLRQPTTAERLVADNQGWLFLRHALRAMRLSTGDVLGISGEDPFIKSLQEQRHQEEARRLKTTREAIIIAPPEGEGTDPMLTHIQSAIDSMRVDDNE